MNWPKMPWKQIPFGDHADVGISLGVVGILMVMIIIEIEQWQQ